MQIAEAFRVLEKGGRPRLFSKKTIPDKERERSPERKHMQTLAAAMLEALMKLGDERNLAAEQIAHYVNRWARNGGADSYREHGDCVAPAPAPLGRGAAQAL